MVEEVEDLVEAIVEIVKVAEVVTGPMVKVTGRVIAMLPNQRPS